ncbi:MAG: RNA 2',3'-cyclic phosphodiesterase [Pseudomonadota bacterium]
MPRLFIGLEIPAQVGNYLGALRGGIPGARFIEPSDYHITLRFIGDIDIRMANEIADMLGAVRRKSFTLRLSELRSFGKDSPHSIVATLHPSPELTELQAELERMMQRLGFPSEGRKYTPHITIARLKNSGVRDVGEWIVTRSPLSSAPFPVNRFVLFSSRASTGGGPYIVEGEYPLSAGVAVQK